MSWYLRVLKQYAVFRGRARRKEFWLFWLVHLLIMIAVSFVDAALGTAEEDVGPVFLAYYALTFLPSLAVSVRRLHDTGRSGWWILLNAVPVVGSLVVLAFSAMDGVPGDNEYGPSPKEHVPSRMAAVA